MKSQSLILTKYADTHTNVSFDEINCYVNFYVNKWLNICSFFGKLKSQNLGPPVKKWKGKNYEC